MPLLTGSPWEALSSHPGAAVGQRPSPPPAPAGRHPISAQSAPKPRLAAPHGQRRELPVRELPGALGWGPQKS